MIVYNILCLCGYSYTGTTNTHNYSYIGIINKIGFILQSSIVLSQIGTLRVSIGCKGVGIVVDVVAMIKG